MKVAVTAGMRWRQRHTRQIGRGVLVPPPGFSTMFSTDTHVSHRCNISHSYAMFFIHKRTSKSGGIKMGLKISGHFHKSIKIGFKIFGKVLKRAFKFSATFQPLHFVAVVFICVSNYLQVCKCYMLYVLVCVFSTGAGR